MKRMLVVTLIVLMTLGAGGLAQAGYYCGCVGIGGDLNHYTKIGCGNGGMGANTADHALVRKEDIGYYIKDAAQLKKLLEGGEALDKQTGWYCH